MGLRDAPMVESVTDGEKQRHIQAPNRKEVWSRSQARRDEAMSGPRFEQTMMHMQVSLLFSYREKRVIWNPGRGNA